MSIYDYTLSQATTELLPPSKRKPNNQAYLGVPGSILQKYHDLFFNTYADGNIAPDWISGATYNYQDQVRYTENTRYNNRIYELNNSSGITGITLTPPNDPDNWVIVQNNFIGVRERSKYNSFRVVFEYALNKWFKTTFRQPLLTSDIFLSKDIYDNNTFIIGDSEAVSGFVAFTDDEQEYYITDSYIFNSFLFAINIPLTVYDSLSPSEPSGFSAIKESIVRSFADKYVFAGITYTIKRY